MEDHGLVAMFWDNLKGINRGDFSSCMPSSR